jgi:hypothetical protein
VIAAGPFMIASISIGNCIFPIEITPEPAVMRGESAVIAAGSFMIASISVRIGA